MRPNLADESLKEYGLAQGLNITQASSLPNMTMSSGIGMKMGDNVSMSSMSSSQTLNLTNKKVVDQSHFESSSMIAKSLKTLFMGDLKIATLEKSNGLDANPNRDENGIGEKCRTGNRQSCLSIKQESTFV